jgi:hypothetical protein
MGFEKMVIEVDAKEAAQAGLMAKPLTSLNVQKHLVRDVVVDCDSRLHVELSKPCGM